MGVWYPSSRNKKNRTEKLKQALSGIPLKTSYKEREFTKEWVESIPKTINDKGCYIPIYNKPANNGYVPITIKGVKYQLHRLVVAIYNNLDYHDQLWDARHGEGCDRACFFHEHLQSGTLFDNQQDSVLHKTHVNTKKTHCPKCGSEYRTRVTQTGWSRGEIKRICPICSNKGRIR